MDTSSKPSLLFSLVSWTSREKTEAFAPEVEAATALFEIHRQPLLRYLLSFGLPAQECDEIVQEVFVSLFLHLQAGKSRENLEGWLFCVAHNLGLKMRSRIAGDRLVVLDTTIAEQHPDPHPNSEQRMMNLERSQRLRAVVSALAQPERQCLFLRAEGLRYREIAHVLGLSLGSVSNLLARSLGKLRRADATTHEEE